LPVENEKCSIDTYKKIDDIWIGVIQCIQSLMDTNGIIHTDFSCIKEMLTEAGIMFFGTGKSTSNEKPILAFERAMVNPMLDYSIENAANVLLLMSGNIPLTDVQAILAKIKGLISKDANVVWGSAIEEDNDYTVSIIAVRKNN